MYATLHLKQQTRARSAFALAKPLAICAVLAGLSGCSSDMDQLKAQIAEIRNRPGERIEALREIKPYEAFVYGASGIRSPFVASAPALSDIASALRPDSKRSREYLEQFPLDSLRMVGILELHGRKYGLVQDRQGLVHRVLPGNYVGQSDGRITSVNNAKISLIQIVPDGLGGYIERPTAMALAE